MIVGVKERKDMPHLVTLVSEIRSWHLTDLCYDHMCQTRLLFSTRNSSLNSGMRLIYCRARFFFQGAETLPLFCYRAPHQALKVMPPVRLTAYSPYGEDLYQLQLWGQGKCLSPAKYFRPLTLLFKRLISLLY